MRCIARCSGARDEKPGTRPERVTRTTRVCTRPCIFMVTIRITIHISVNESERVAREGGRGQNRQSGEDRKERREGERERKGEGDMNLRASDKGTPASERLKTRLNEGGPL